MANYIGGDMLEISCQHPLGDFRFAPKANESFTVDGGGVRANDDVNQVTSAGEMISQLNRVRWSVEGPIAVDLNSNYEKNNLSAMAGHPELGIWTFVHISGQVEKGKGRPVGDIQPDTNAATLTLKVSGGGTLEKL